MRTRFRSALAAALATTVLTIGVASAAPGNKILDANMTGMAGSSEAAMFPNVIGGGAPWVISRGDAKLFADGHLVVEVRGLVLETLGINPPTIPTGRAIVYCNAGANIVMTDPVPFSTAGDATVDTTVALPSPCHGAIVFFAGQTGGGPRWFAVTGS